MVYDGSYWVWTNATIPKASAITDGTLNPDRLPFATQNTKGAVKMYLSGTTLYLSNV